MEQAFLILVSFILTHKDPSKPFFGEMNEMIESPRCSNIILRALEISKVSDFGRLSKCSLLPNPSGHSSLL
jgi:hypothetical protein